MGVIKRHSHESERRSWGLTHVMHVSSTLPFHKPLFLFDFSGNQSLEPDPKDQYHMELPRGIYVVSEIRVILIHLLDMSE